MLRCVGGGAEACGGCAARGHRSDRGGAGRAASRARGGGNITPRSRRFASHARSTRREETRRSEGVVSSAGSLSLSLFLSLSICLSLYFSLSLSVSLCLSLSLSLLCGAHQTEGDDNNATSRGLAVFSRHPRYRTPPLIESRRNDAPSSATAGYRCTAEDRVLRPQLSVAERALGAGAGWARPPRLPRAPSAARTATQRPPIDRKWPRAGGLAQRPRVKGSRRAARRLYPGHRAKRRVDESSRGGGTSTVERYEAMIVGSRGPAAVVVVVGSVCVVGSAVDRWVRGASKEAVCALLHHTAATLLTHATWAQSRRHCGILLRGAEGVQPYTTGAALELHCRLHSGCTRAALGLVNERNQQRCALLYYTVRPPPVAWFVYGGSTPPALEWKFEHGARRSPI